VGGLQAAGSGAAPPAGAPRASRLTRRPPSNPPGAPAHQVRNLTAACARASCAGRVDAELRASLARLLPPDAAARCSGRAFISVSGVRGGNASSNASSSGAPAFIPILVSEFPDREDLISTLAASSYIPGWSGAAPAVAWRGGAAVDGGFTNVRPCAPAAAGGGGYCAKVVNVAPGVGGAAAGPTPERLRAAIALAAAGGRPSADGVPPPLLPGTPPAGFEARAAALRARGADIAPGLSLDIPYNASMLNEVRRLGAPRAWSRLGGR
jgi:hypothetical protein